MELSNEYLAIFFDQYKNLTDAVKRNLGNWYDPINYFLDTCDHSVWFENEELVDKTPKKTDKEESVDFSDMPPLECDDEVKEEKALEILTPSKLLTRLPILLTQIKTGNNSHKLKNEIRKMLYLLYQHNKITKKITTI